MDQLVHGEQKRWAVGGDIEMKLSFSNLSLPLKIGFVYIYINLAYLIWNMLKLVWVLT